jgi:hypothetical protein
MALPDSTTYLDRLEILRHKTGLLGQALLDAFAESEKGMQYIPKHEMQRTSASYCAEIVRYLAEMRFMRDPRADGRRACLATLKQIWLIEMNFGEATDIVVECLVEQMLRQQKALAT